jgi:iron complex transport system permease protein
MLRQSRLQRTLAHPWSGLGLALAVVLLAVLAIAWGPYPMSALEVWQVLATGMLGLPQSADPLQVAVVFELRGPRVLAAVFVGAALASAGAAYQSVFRNPLVSPDILGVAAGAALGAMLAWLFGWTGTGIQVMAFMGGVSAVVLVYAVAARVRSADPVLVLVLVGVVLASLFGAAVALVKTIADPQQQLPAMTFWLLGSLTGVEASQLWWLGPAVIACTAILWVLRWKMNVLLLADSEAQSLGVSTHQLRLGVIACATMMTAAAVATAGIVGWVGLVVPHMARVMVGASLPRLLPLALALGAAFLLIVDLLARSLTAVEIPLGVLTAVIGTPLFLWQLLSQRRGAV